jgi:hypothetical protein
MAVPQITVRLKPDTKAAFEAYSERVGMDTSELAKLLIVRERKLGRLAALKAEGRSPVRRRQARGAAIALPTVTAHLSSVEQVAEFDKYARLCGLNRNSAAAWLLEAEVQECWLERALLLF